MGLEDEDIEKVFLQIVEPRSDTDKKVAEFIDILLEEMVKSREKEIEARKRREEKGERKKERAGIDPVLFLYENLSSYLNDKRVCYNSSVR